MRIQPTSNFAHDIHSEVLEQTVMAMGYDRHTARWWVWLRMFADNFEHDVKTSREERDHRARL